MTQYNDLLDKRHDLVIELADTEREILKYNNATLFVDNKKRRKKKSVTVSTQLPKDWWPTPEQLIKAREEITNIEIGTETEKFKNYYQARGRAMKDWTACWRNWMINASSYMSART